MNYLFLIWNSSLLTASSARDIHSTKTMLVRSVYFQFPQSKQNNFDCVKTIDIQQKLLVQYKLWLSWAYYQALKWLQALTMYTRQSLHDGATAPSSRLQRVPSKCLQPFHGLIICTFSHQIRPQKNSTLAPRNIIYVRQSNLTQPNLTCASPPPKKGNMVQQTLQINCFLVGSLQLCQNQC